MFLLLEGQECSLLYSFQNCLSHKQFFSPLSWVWTNLACCSQQYQFQAAVDTTWHFSQDEQHFIPKQWDVLLDPTYLYPLVVTGWGLIWLLFKQLIQHSRVVAVLGICNLISNYDSDDKQILVLCKLQIIVDFFSEVMQMSLLWTGGVQLELVDL